MKGKAKAGYIAVRVFEAVHWVGAALCLLMAVWVLLEPDWFLEMNKEAASSQVVRYGFMGGLDVAAAGGTGFDAGVQTLLAVGGAAALALGALVFRRLGQVIRLCHGGTPFQKAVVDKVRQMGWLVIAEPVATAAVSLLAYIVYWPDYSFKIDVTGVVMGVVILALSRIFAYGVKLEDDVEGLL